MKVKRTVAPDMRSAIRKVREEQGPDAVILANRKVAEGVEIISAIDLDPESLYGAGEGTEIQVSGPISSRSIDDRSAADEPPASSALRSRPRRSRDQQIVDQPDWSMRQDPGPQEFDRFNSELSRIAKENPVPRDPVKRPAAPRQSVASKPRDHFAEQARPAHQKRSVDEEPWAGNDLASRASAQPESDYPRPTSSAARSNEPPSGDYAISDMRKELQQLRSMMQNQMSVLEFGRVTNNHPLRVSLLSRLYEFGLGTDLAKELVEEVQEKENIERAWRQALGLLSNRIPISEDDFMSHGGVIAVVGPTGVGKTTSVAKLAARFAMRHGSRNVALVSTDNYRVGAQEQLLNYARILNVPVKMAGNQDELSRALNSLYDKKLVLIDTAGMSQRDMRLSEQFTTLREGSPLIKPYLTMSATAQLRTLDETIRAFSRVDLAGCILTKLDETSAIGAALTAVIRHRLPLSFLGTGQRVPEDLQLARAHRLVSRAFSEAAESSHDQDAESIAARFAEAQYDATN